MNLKTIDTKLTALAGLCLLVGGGTGFSGLIPVGAAVVISLVGVLAGAVAKSPVFSGTPESGWNVALQILAALFAGAAGSAQLGAVQKLLMPVHPAWAAKIGLGAMLGSQVFAYLAQKREGDGAAKVGVLLLAFVLPGVSSCAHFGPVVQEFSSCEEPDAQKICQEIKPRLIDLLACSGLDVDLAPPCAAAALADLYRDHGHFVVNCALLAIRDAFKAEPNAKPAELARASLIRARAESFLDGEIKAGEKVPSAARTPGVRRNP